MSDEADHAQRFEEAEREAALAAARRREPEPGQHRRGRQVICIDCGEPIPAARLAVRPHAARCTECEALVERQLKRA